MALHNLLLLRTALTCALLLVVSCATVPTGQILDEAGPMPTPEQAEGLILRHLARALRDPEGMKSFSVLTQPEVVTGTNAGKNYERAWLVCVEYNAKNAYGGYAGLTTEEYVMRFAGGDLILVSRINWITQDRRC